MLRRHLRFIAIILNVVKKVIVLSKFEVVVADKLILETVKSLLCESEITLDFEAARRTALTDICRQELLLRILLLQFLFFNCIELQVEIKLFPIHFA